MGCETVSSARSRCDAKIWETCFKVGGHASSAVAAPDPQPNVYRSRCPKTNYRISSSPHNHHPITIALHIPTPSPPCLPFILNNPRSPAPASYALHVSETNTPAIDTSFLPFSRSFAPHTVSDTQRGYHGLCMWHGML